MEMRLDLFCLGFAEYTFGEGDAALVFEALRAHGISPKGIKRDEKTGNFHFFCTLKTAAVVNGCALPLQEVRRGGVPVLAKRLSFRPGLLCGVLFAILLMIGARLFVWDVTVEGNEHIATDELLGELSAAGLKRGTFLPRLDEDAVALSLRQGDGRVAFAAVNLRGTVAQVQIREAVTHKAPVTAPANLVAKCDGVVVLPLVFEGEALVSEGDVVRAGQILAGGIIDSEKHGYRVTRAAGQVLARTVHTYTVRVPLSYEEKAYTGKTCYDVDLLFFGFQGKLFKNSGNLTMECDIIQNIKWWTLSNGRTLPIGLAVTEYEAYETCTLTRTAAQARALATEELEAQLAADSAGRTVLQRTVETAADAEGITLICTLVCEEDIALVSEFDVTPH